MLVFVVLGAERMAIGAELAEDHDRFTAWAERRHITVHHFDMLGWIPYFTVPRREAWSFLQGHSDELELHAFMGHWPPVENHFPPVIGELILSDEV